MDNQPTPPSKPLQIPSHPLLPPARPGLVAKVRAWLRGRTGRIVVPVVAFILGILFGIMALLLIGRSGEGQLRVVTTGQGDIIVETDKAFLSHLVSMNLSKAGLPGTIQNVNVELATGDQMTINGDDTFSLFGIGVTRHFTVLVQPYISSCSLQIHVVQANLSGIPVTGFASSFETHINRQLAQKPTGLPEGFQYCATRVRTTPEGMFVTYAATPLSMNGANYLNRMKEVEEAME